MPAPATVIPATLLIWAIWNLAATIKFLLPTEKYPTFTAQRFQFILNKVTQTDDFLITNSLFK